LLVVKILYDLDIEAQGCAEELGITLRRSASLDASEGVLNLPCEMFSRGGGDGA